MNLTLAEKFLKQAKDKKGQEWTKTAVKKLTVAFRKYFKVQKKDYLDDLKSEMEFVERLLKADTWNDTDEARKELELLLIETTSAMSKKGAELLLKNLDISSDFWITDLVAENYAKNRAGEMIWNIDTTTRKQINWIITRWIEKGADYTQISKLISERFKWFSKYRAELIAVNEIWNAYEYWKISQARDYSQRSWNQMMKKSISQWDSKVSLICRKCENDWWIKTEEDFTWWYERPTFHIWCRCYAKYKTVSNI